MLNKFILVPVLFLTACGGQIKVNTAQIERPSLELVEQKPLALKPVHFKVKVNNEDKKPEYVLDGKNFANLANNMEKVQNHLDIQKKQLEASKHYYDKLNK